MRRTTGQWLAVTALAAAASGTSIDAWSARDSRAASAAPASASAAEPADPREAGAGALWGQAADAGPPIRFETSAGPSSAVIDGRLQAIHSHIMAGRLKDAAAHAEALTREAPHFHLAHLLLGDIRSGQAGRFGAQAVVPQSLRMSTTLGDTLQPLRQEARHRILALLERPPTGFIPSTFVALPETVRHAIAVDTSRHRLYLFERSDKGLRLIADHYVALGKAGVDKTTEGDQRTPVGVYFTTSRLASGQLGDLYGSGALTLNYPNEVDRLKGRTGSGIWVHGSPSSTYARSPLSTDGCVVLSNPDMSRILRTVAHQGTPVVLSHRLDWIEPHASDRSNRGLSAALREWWDARDDGDNTRLAGFYAPTAVPMAQIPSPVRRVSTRDGIPLPRFQNPKDLSILTWRDQFDHAVVTFGDVGRGARKGVIRRQYWAHDGKRWRIVHEGLAG